MCELVKSIKKGNINIKTSRQGMIIEYVMILVFSNGWLQIEKMSNRKRMNIAKEKVSIWDSPPIVKSIIRIVIFLWEYCFRIFGRSINRAISTKIRANKFL